MPRPKLAQYETVSVSGHSVGVEGVAQSVEQDVAPPLNAARLQAILASKPALRRDLATRPITEKLRTLVALREPIRREFVYYN